ncbi:hypothetical protein [Tepidiforma sp.]|uniref:hypothetical protein n=1 Tax=Tepidiforma sp. TaxID=2682230 RepID=UPI002ADE2264|nr:hypothetical protein [Tepidiforma sp.]
MSSHRISPPRVYPEATRAARPPTELAGSADTHRQTSFILREELDLLVEGLELEGQHAQVAAGSKFRNRVVAAVFGPWSRGWLARLQALHATEWGDYSSAAVLVRAAADFEAAAAAHLSDRAAEWTSWLEAGGIGEAPSLRAAEFRTHPFRSAESLARNPTLGSVYREASLFALPHLGTTALLTASESNGERYLATFADRDFHLGLAELVFGWLLRLGIGHAEIMRTAGAELPPLPQKAEDWAARAARLVARRNRCRLEDIEVEGESRLILVNWRREPRGAPKRVLV